MANSQYEYVKSFESNDAVLPSCWLCVRIDGHAFHKFTQQHQFEKPNDKRGLDLMNRAAQRVMQQFPQICLAYGVSDEFSFILPPCTSLYNRRESKLNSSIVSCFAAHYVFEWPQFFPHTRLHAPPLFDSRLVVYPNDAILKDYLRWRQVDCHINNLYNTLYWKLVDQKKCTTSQAQAVLRDSDSAVKNEMLFSEFGCNYNAESAQYRKGTILLWQSVPVNASSEQQTAKQPQQSIDNSISDAVVVDDDDERDSSEDQAEPHANGDVKDSARSATHLTANNGSSAPTAASPSNRTVRRCVILHEDLIQEEFWTKYPGIVPFISLADQRKIEKVKSKAERKIAHKLREKLERSQAKAQTQQTQE